MLNLYTKYYLLAIIIMVLLSSCSKTPDVRLTLCQDLTQSLLDKPRELQWLESKSIIKGYQDLEIKIQFSTEGSASSSYASCFYAYEQDEIGAETFQNPEAAYSAYPSKMILKGTEVDKMLLSKTINQVMLHQGKKALEKIKT